MKINVKGAGGDAGRDTVKVSQKEGMINYEQRESMARSSLGPNNMQSFVQSTAPHGDEVSPQE